MLSAVWRSDENFSSVLDFSNIVLGKTDLDHKLSHRVTFHSKSEDSKEIALL